MSDSILSIRVIVDFIAVALALYGPMLIGFLFLCASREDSDSVIGGSVFAAWGLAFFVAGYLLQSVFAAGIGVLCAAIIIAELGYGSPRGRKMRLIGVCWGLGVYSVIGLYIWWRSGG